jgi:hypothetical protein
MNGEEITTANIRQLITEDLQHMKPGARIIFTVGRKTDKGEIKKKKLKGRVTPIEHKALHVLRPAPNATPQQKQLRAAWLNQK